MKIYVPYSGQYLPLDFMKHIAEDMGVKIEIEATGRRPRLRKACDGSSPLESDSRNKPHWEYEVRLRPLTDNYRKWSAGIGVNVRRVNAVCWHGHKRFMTRFLAYYKEATIRTALAEYNGENSFAIKHGETNDQQFNSNTICGCAYSQM